MGLEAVSMGNSEESVEQEVIDDMERNGGSMAGQLRTLQKNVIYPLATVVGSNRSLANDCTPQSNLQIPCNPYQTTNSNLHRTRTKKFSLHGNINSQSHLEKEKWSWRNQAS